MEEKIIIGDIHGNLELLDKFLDYAKNSQNQKNNIIMYDCGNSFNGTAFARSTTKGVIDCG